MLTTEKVLKRFSEEVETRPESEVTHSDRALDALFSSQVVSDAIKTYIENNEDHFVHDSSVFSFHKSFREWGVIEDKNLALAVWLLIHESPLFLETIKVMNKEESQDFVIHVDLTDQKTVTSDNMNNHHYT